VAESTSGDRLPRDLKGLKDFFVEFDELTHLLISILFLPTLELNLFFDVYFRTNKRSGLRALFPNIGFDYLPLLSIPGFILTSIRRSCARYTAAAFPAICLFSDLYREQKYK
jgi:hypothetical protein